MSYIVNEVERVIYNSKHNSTHEWNCTYIVNWLCNYSQKMSSEKRPSEKKPYS